MCANNNECTLHIKLCNGINDCSDNSDEKSVFCDGKTILFLFKVQIIFFYICNLIAINFSILVI